MAALVSACTVSARERFFPQALSVSGYSLLQRRVIASVALFHIAFAPIGATQARLTACPRYRLLCRARTEVARKETGHEELSTGRRTEIEGWREPGGADCQL